ncbi:hypothetical protein [Shinella sp.]|uniref:hypothetical protein n=1 Tax=Shinella sp. TaxID=1870904 RepID=UPI002590BC32|nr:hypothetical protein [Shinella sp.]MCW5708698.1 hypothetical protein [Shinella sp.]
MSKRLIQDLHAGISRRDWWAVETAANRLRDDVEKTVDILAGTGVGSLPNDYPLSQLAAEAIAVPVRRWRVFEAIERGWWGIEIDGDNDADPILYSQKALSREKLEEIVSAHNASLSSKGQADE